LVPTMRTGEGMALPHATQPTPRAILAGIGRIHVVYQQPAPLGSVCDAHPHQAALPLAQASARALSHPQLLGSLWERQALEYQYRVIRRPTNQFGGGLLTEGARAVALLATKPFQQAAERARVLLLCLVGRKLFLQAATSLAGADVAHLELPPADEEGIPIGIDGNQGVGLVQVDPNRVNALRIGDAQGDDHATEQAPVAFDDRHAVDLSSFGKRLLEGIRHGV